MKLIHEVVIFATASIGWMTGTVIDANSLVPVGTALSVGAGIWYLSARLQRLQDTTDELNRGQKRINDRLDGLPCAYLDCERKRKT